MAYPDISVLKHRATQNIISNTAVDIYGLFIALRMLPRVTGPSRRNPLIQSKFLSVQTVGETLPWAKHTYITCRQIYKS